MTEDPTLGLISYTVVDGTKYRQGGINSSYPG